MSVNKKPFKEAYFFQPLTAKEKERKKCFCFSKRDKDYKRKRKKEVYQNG